MPNNTKHKYTIYCLQEIEYVGSTKHKINIRMNLHSSICNNPNAKGYSKPLYKHIRQHCPSYSFTVEDVIILDQAMLTEKQARAVEQEWINILKPKHNFIDAYSGADNHAEYNKTKITCPCGVISNKAHITRHKRSNKHKNKIKEITNTLNQYYKTSEDNHHCTLKHNEKFK